MPAPSFELRLIEDNLRTGRALALPADGINRVVYVAHGGIAVAGKSIGDDEAWHGHGAATITAREHGAALWRWELAPADSSIAQVAENDGASRLKLGCPLAWPIAGAVLAGRSGASPDALAARSGPGPDALAARSGPGPDAALLMRADSVSFPSGGCAFLHTHQGPGIRCLIDGGIRIDTEGHSTCYAPGGAWFESGPAPVFAQGAADRPSRFIRVMVLPASLKGKSSISYVRAEDRDKPKSQSYKGYVDSVIDIA